MKNPALSHIGFTLVEVLIVMAIFASLVGVATFGTFSQIRKGVLEATTDEVIATIREAQTKAMGGDTAGSSSSQYFGVYFDTKSYTLFKGYNYVPTDSYNFKVNLDNNLIFSSISLPSCSDSYANRCVVFLRVSGEVHLFDQAVNRFTLKDTQTGKEVSFTINQLGVINAQ